jgi:hypothetical protein
MTYFNPKAKPNPNQINQENPKRINFKIWENDVMSVWWLETSENRGNEWACKEGPEQEV